jgi:D-arabinose 1-dehydrogenase-like Zn-dependent alcohol dehydrogenase
LADCIAPLVAVAAKCFDTRANCYCDRNAIVETEDLERLSFQSTINPAAVCRAFETPRRRDLGSARRGEAIDPYCASHRENLCDRPVFTGYTRAAWAGSSGETLPEPLDAAIIYAPAGELVPIALASVRKGGIVVCAGIHMSDIPSFPYRLLWEERQIVSVANLTRQDAVAFLAFAAKSGIETRTKTYPLNQANSALADLRAGRLEGAAVLLPPSG